MLDKEYISFISDIKIKIRQAQIKAAIKVNEELLRLYWDIAKMIVDKQKSSSWGDGIIEQISRDLKQEFPNLKGFSVRNLKYMKQWYLFWVKGQQVVAQIFQIPWGHNIVIITKCKTIEEALFYVKKTIENGYSRAVLVHQIESDLYSRSKKAINNFDKKLPAPQSDLAKEITKDPYCFDFLSLNEKYNEKELENALMDHLTNFLLELGSGFAFVGRQYRLEIAGEEFFIDLLFYHIKLIKCFVVIELKTTKFKPEYAGKLNFYITAVDKEIKSDDDNPTIGILICKSKNNTIVEYALNSIEKPIGVSEYKLFKELPKELKNTLPSIEEIESQLQKIEAKNESN
ncbi:PDDEXK nuclease domain-containing protein [Nitrosophilus labii]|uniref:PDDEXK nuclease domain-containing protein n=1 Tax=Nitrosophilus labii TaxID=2706014 RepID=UPI001656BBB0|nr:PDDEXK nuclease domain-containing protein [Nitrosophilus labii]